MRYARTGKVMNPECERLPEWGTEIMRRLSWGKEREEKKENRGRKYGWRRVDNLGGIDELENEREREGFLMRKQLRGE